MVLNKATCLPFTVCDWCVLILHVELCLQISNDPSPGYNIEQMAKKWVRATYCSIPAGLL